MNRFRIQSIGVDNTIKYNVLDTHRESKIVGTFDDYKVASDVCGTCNDAHDEYTSANEVNPLCTHLNAKGRI